MFPLFLLLCLITFVTSSNGACNETIETDGLTIYVEKDDNLCDMALEEPLRKLIPPTTKTPQVKVKIIKPTKKAKFKLKEIPETIDTTDDSESTTEDSENTTEDSETLDSKTKKIAEEEYEEYETTIRNSRPPSIRNSRKNPFCLMCCTSQNPPGKICGKHTFCLYKNSQEIKCKGLLRLTSSEKTLVLHTHNTLRSRVASGAETHGNPGPQPIAANMLQLQWNTELEKLAELWIMQCIDGNDLCRDLPYFSVGQNVGNKNFSPSIGLPFIDIWYSEVLRSNLRKKKKTWSNYRQIVWANTAFIGCARIVFTNDTEIKNTLMYKQRMICNYGPAGNIPGESPYIIGQPCSRCPQETFCSHEYKGLCSGMAQPVSQNRGWRRMERKDPDCFKFDEVAPSGSSSSRMKLNGSIVLLYFCLIKSIWYGFFFFVYNMRKYQNL